MSHKQSLYVDTKTEFVAFDVETTGLWPMTHRIVELAAIRFDDSGREIARFHSLVNPGRPMSRGAFHVHGISDAMVAYAPDATAVLPEFVDFLGNPRHTLLMAHHATFDAGFVGCELARRGLSIPGHPIVDTLELAQACLKGPRSYSLPSLAEDLGLDPIDTHRALGDCGRVKALWDLFGKSAGDRLKKYFLIDHAAFRVPPPEGWDDVQDAIDHKRFIRIVYQWGQELKTPFDATPIGFLRKGGYLYLETILQFDQKERTFRLDRIKERLVIEELRR